MPETTEMADADKSVNKSSHDPGHNNHHLTESTIMIVDDESTTIEVVQAFLEDFGYRNFVQVDQSAQAMTILEKTVPDIVLLDLMMPEVNGFEILSEVRAHPKFSHLPIIILTASSDTGNKLRALDLGATDFLAKPVDQSELGLRVRNTLAAKAYLDQLAYYDPLTKLPNRHLFFEHFEWVINKAKRHKEDLALLTISLDNFDRINATMGLKAGDEVLRLVASRISQVVRSTDILGCDVHDQGDLMNLFRMEGSIFSLLLDRVHGAESAAAVAERIIQSIKQPLIVNKSDTYVTASVGIATYPVESEDSAVLVRLATRAKDYAKNQGGDCFQFSSTKINAIYEKRLTLETKLRKALEKNEFVLFYQPKVDIGSGAIIGVEALIRWNSEDGFVSPGDFIPLAEETGLIIPIGEWVLKESCAQLLRWHESGYKLLSTSVNLSVKQFQDPNFLVVVQQIIDECGIDPRFITLELTESLLLDDIEIKIEILEYLKNMGFRLSIDDFGTGYSSLNYLRRLPVDELKIDRSFVMALSEGSDSNAIVSSIIYLSQSLGLQTVAEGVETNEELSFLKSKNCDQFQGFLFSKPLPGDKLAELLSR